MSSVHPVFAFVFTIAFFALTVTTSVAQTSARVPIEDGNEVAEDATTEYVEFETPVPLTSEWSVHKPVFEQIHFDSNVDLMFNTSSAVVGHAFRADLLFNNTQTTNGGPFDISFVTVTFTHDASWTVDSWSQTFTAGFNAFESCESATTTFTCTAITFPKGHSQTFSLIINPTLAGTFSSTLQSTQAETDPNTADNTVTKSLAVTALGAIAGTIFEDRDGNGFFGNTGATPETASTAGGTVFIDADNNGTQNTGDPTATVNGSNGTFLFSNLTPGIYSVNYQPTPPWRRIDTGVAISASVTAGNSTTVDFGVFKDGTISGTICFVTNSNENCSTGTGVSGATVTVIRPDGSTDASTLSGATGEFTLVFTGEDVSTSNPCQLSVRIDGPTGFNDTSRSICVNSGETLTNQDFIVFVVGTIFGTVYIDKTANNINNGTFDAPFTLGGMASLTDAIGGAISGFPDVTVDQDGNFMFENLPAGIYHVSVPPPSGWSATEGKGGVMITIDGNTVLQGFGMFKEGTLSVTVCNDTTPDDACSAGEPGISSWIVDILRPDGTVSSSATVSESGNSVEQPFTSENIDPTVPCKVNVRVTLPAGSPSTTLTKQVCVESGSQSQIDFAVNPFGSILIRLYHDLDGNGIQGPLESMSFSTPVVAAWRDTNGNGQLEVNDESPTTNSIESTPMVISPLSPGDYPIGLEVLLDRATQQPTTEWRLTEPTIKLVPVVAGKQTIVSWGLFKNGTVSVHVCNGGNASNTCDGQPGIAGTQVGVDTNHNGDLTGESSSTTVDENPVTLTFSGDDVVRTDPCNVRLIANLPAGSSETSLSKDVCVHSGEIAKRVDFVVAPFGSIVIVAYEDANANGIKDPGEAVVEPPDGPVMAFWKDDNNNGSLDPAESSQATSNLGATAARIGPLAPGTYAIAAVISTAFGETSPWRLTEASVKSVPVLAGQESRVYFGVFKEVTLSAKSCIVTNGADTCDSSSSPLPDADVGLDRNKNNKIDSNEKVGKSDANGHISFTTLATDLDPVTGCLYSIIAEIKSSSGDTANTKAINPCVRSGDILTNQWLVLALSAANVSSSSDGGDTTPGDGVCDDGTGSCSLRAAIEEAIASGLPAFFSFPSGKRAITLTPASPYPAFTVPIIIQGNNQVEIDGSNAGANANGFTVNAGGSSITGVSMHGFSGDGIRISAPSGLIVGNQISSNGGAGIAIATGTGNRISRNTLFSNAGLGIDLNADGLSVNDADEADTGANNLQNFPVISKVTAENGHIEGSLTSTTNATYTLEFFANDECDASGNGEGQRYLGTSTLSTDATGSASFVADLTEAIGLGNAITSTATDSTGNTSELSSCFTAITTAIERDETAELPSAFKLDQNYPNPFNPVTNIRFALAERTFVNLEVYDVLGKRVARLVDKWVDAGEYSVSFDASGLPSGIYLYQMTAGSFSRTRSLTLLK